MCVLTLALIISVSSAVAPASSTVVCNVQMTDLLECLPAITELAKFGANPVAAMAVPKKCGIKHIIIAYINIQIYRSRTVVSAYDKAKNTWLKIFRLSPAPRLTLQSV
nr:hypothetical protein [Tanacetum cinerariifolium]